ncbi:MAG: DNA polymerase III subunit delta, partial [Pseudomonadota bacterium]
QCHIREGDAPSAAMKKLRPPIFFAEQKRFEDQLRRWPIAALETALTDLFQTDLDAKRTGMPQRQTVERTLLRLAMGASRR